MSDIALKVENLTKEYRLGTIGHGTLREDLQSAWSKLRGKEDPNSLITSNHNLQSEKKHFLALNDISLEIKKGDRVGIIGKNGAGKSTLLKVLSQITAPTKGNIFINGRIGSLLEVGTGFHPELTGRENIYLNGSIMGMKKWEIDSKFDEIVDFSGVEKFIDTPIKRYSSGMFVRLGFAVAAHLEPDILIVDEVLAVGDAEFQKKAIGKMKDVSNNDGRTILFVSHNMGSLKKLCTKGVFLNDGKMVLQSDVNEAIKSYLNSNNSTRVIDIFSNIHISKPAQITNVRLVNNKGEKVNKAFNQIKHNIEIVVNFMNEFRGIAVSYELINSQGISLYWSSSIDNDIDNFGNHIYKKGEYLFSVPLPLNILREDDYIINVALTIPKVEILDRIDNCLFFKIIDTISPATISGEKRDGLILPIAEWKNISLS